MELAAKKYLKRNLEYWLKELNLSDKLEVLFANSETKGIRPSIEMEKESEEEITNADNGLISYDPIDGIKCVLYTTDYQFSFSCLSTLDEEAEKFRSLIIDKIRETGFPVSVDDYSFRMFGDNITRKKIYQDKRGETSIYKAVFYIKIRASIIKNNAC